MKKKRKDFVVGIGLYGCIMKYYGTDFESGREIVFFYNKRTKTIN